MSLPLNLPGIIVERTEADGPMFAIHAGCEGKPSNCPTCGATAIYAHGTFQQDIMDLPHQGRFACVHLARKRWKCQSCGITFFHPLDWIDDDHRATKRFVDRIAGLSLERSFSDLAREYGVNEKTIRNIFYKRYEEEINTTRFQSPEYMGIDEIKIAGGLRGVITNISDKTGIEFLPKNTSVVLTEYFNKMPNKERVKAVSIDCAQHYRDLIYRHFPNASVVADKYHILRSADFAVDKIRIAMRDSIDTKRMKLKLKKDKYILKTREHSLSDWERSQVQMWKQNFPIIGATYDLKEEFYRIYDAKTEAEARLRFHTWRHNIPEQTEGQPKMRGRRNDTVCAEPRSGGDAAPRTYPQNLCISLKKAAPAQAQALGKQGDFHWLLLFWAQLLASPFPQGAACPGSDAR